jgi:erythromycin esterase-like protein
VRITRTGPDDYAHQDLGGVSFVPLVGEQGWTEQGDRALPGRSSRRPSQHSLSQRIAAVAHPLPAIAAPSFAEAFDRYGGRRVVLLGECSHGTAEFYDARAAITRMLVERHGFGIVAVEADWPDAAAIDRHVHGVPQPSAAPAPFQRFPTWMWRNAEFARFAEWLRQHNAGRSGDDTVGFYGLDLYNLRGAIAAVLDYLDRTDPDAAAVARERYGCLTPWQQDPATYGRAVLSAGYRGCEEAVVRQCRELLERHLEQAGEDGAPLLDAAHSARVVASAERYYRVMYYGGAEAWNLRDQHMFETLDLLLQAKGPRAKAVVWAHNSHIGDARHTDMGRHRDELNIGQLCRERFGDEAALIGFGTDRGTVAAAHDWDGDLQIMDVRPARADSVERLCHEAGRERFLLELADGPDAGLREELREDRLQRFIGVIYRPHSELLSHYAAVSLSDQFDAYVWFDETRAVAPLGPQEPLPGHVPETYPFGL